MEKFGLERPVSAATGGELVEADGDASQERGRQSLVYLLAYCSGFLSNFVLQAALQK